MTFFFLEDLKKFFKKCTCVISRFSLYSKASDGERRFRGSME